MVEEAAKKRTSVFSNIGGGVHAKMAVGRTQIECQLDEDWQRMAPPPEVAATPVMARPRASALKPGKA